MLNYESRILNGRTGKERGPGMDNSGALPMIFLSVAFGAKRRSGADLKLLICQKLIS